VRTHVALLKGINVGGNNVVKMPVLRDLFSSLGFSNVETLLQSGNVAFTSPTSSTAELELLLEAELIHRLNLKISVVVLDTSELQAIIDANPFPAAAQDIPNHLLVHFSKDAVDESAVDILQREIRGPESVQAGSRHIYVVYPDGIGTSTIGKTPGWNKLTAGATARNWNTVLKLSNLVNEPFV